MSGDCPGGGERKFQYLPTAHNDLPGDIPEPLFRQVPEGYAYRRPCPCCGEITYPVPAAEAVGYICPVCFWENDVFVRSDDEPSDENGGMSLNEARMEYGKHGVVRPDLLRHRFLLLLLPLEGVLLRSDGTVSPRDLERLRDLRRGGTGIGVAASRSEAEALALTKDLRPDVLITGGGARARAGERLIFTSPFTSGETGSIIKKARELPDPAALGTICRALCLSPKNVIAFGSRPEDAETLRAAGLGVAMDSAAPEVKSVAGVVVGDSVADGITELLDRLSGGRTAEN